MNPENRNTADVRIRDALVLLLCLVPLGGAVGSACALFLWSLDAATATRFSQPWLLYLLPLAGLGVGLIYHHWGKAAEGGNNLILEQIHEPGGGVPRRMAPLILVSTVITHAFGGSAGREGTAVQMGGSIAASMVRALRLDPSKTRVLLMAGIAAGFGGVFGTPVAGAVFALEVLMIGRIQFAALVPCLIAAFVGDFSCRAWGCEHTHYAIHSATAPVFDIDFLLLGKVAVVGMAAGWAAALFAETTHTLHAGFKRLIAYPPLRPVLGGLIIIGLVHLIGTREYLGLGVWSPNPDDMTITGFFHADPAHPWAWALKILFTSITLACGFKGGEVTPLFFIGAALGAAMSGLLDGPTDLLAAVGFVAVFAGASNTPVASTIMGIEMFGATHGVAIATACFLAFLCSGHSGIYLSQRLAAAKPGWLRVPPATTLRHARKLRTLSIQLAIIRVLDGPARSSKSLSNKNDAIPPGCSPAAKQELQIAIIRIDVEPGRRLKSADGGERSLPLYREIVRAANRHGGLLATARTPIDAPNPSVAAEADPLVCVEISGPRDEVEAFLRLHAEWMNHCTVHQEAHDQGEEQGGRSKE